MKKTFPIILSLALVTLMALSVPVNVCAAVPIEDEENADGANASATFNEMLSDSDAYQGTYIENIGCVFLNYDNEYILFPDNEYLGRVMYVTNEKATEYIITSYEYADPYTIMNECHEGMIRLVLTDYSDYINEAFSPDQIELYVISNYNRLVPIMMYLGYPNDNSSLSGMLFPFLPFYRMVS